MRPDRRTGPTGRATAGFTLIEVIVVIAVLAILAGAMAPLIAAKVDQARRFATEDQLQAISDALRAYQRDVDAFPPDTGNPVNDLGELQADTLGLTGWRGPYLTAQWSAGDYAQDAWGGPITYAYVGGAPTAVLTSPGPDQVAGNADDIALTVVQDYESVERRVNDTYERLKLVAGDVYGTNPTKAPATYTIPAAWQTDAWGNNLIYHYSSDESAVVYSAGPDGTPGAGGPSGDDVYFAMVWSPPGGGGSGTGLDNMLSLVAGSTSSCNGGARVNLSITSAAGQDLDVTQMTLTWTGGPQLTRIDSEGAVGSCFGGSDLWRAGSCGTPATNQTSPATLTAFCKAFTVTAGSTYVLNRIQFSASVSGQTLSIVFAYQDSGGNTGTSTISLTVP
jgi:general secretion pathway protein G